MAAEDRVQFVDLARSFGEFEAVRGVSLEIHAGETFGLLGPNGAGKTTTLSMLATLLPPTRGDVLVFGASVVGDPAEVRRRVGLAPQQISLYPTLTAQENLDFFGKLHGVAADVRERRVDELLDLVGLTPRRDDLVRTYSGGMQRRLNLACSLIHEPRLLLLDEPTAGVDPQSRENLFEVIRRIASAGHDGRLHDALHRRGRAPVRSHRDPRRGTHRGRRHAGRAARRGRHGRGDRDPRRRDGERQQRPRGAPGGREGRASTTAWCGSSSRAPRAHSPSSPVRCGSPATRSSRSRSTERAWSACSCT